MAEITEDLELIRRVHAKFGTPKLAAAAELPYTTVRDCEQRDFKFKALDTLQKLADAARKLDAQPDPHPQPGVAA